MPTPLRMLMGSLGGPYPEPPWPADWLSLAHNNDYPGGGTLDNYLHAFTSPDGLAWTKIGSANQAGSILPSATYRDPDLMYYDGQWWCVCQNGALRVFASSTFVDGWSLIVSPASPAGATATWAPSWFIDTDGSVHIIVGCQVSGSFKLYETHPTVDGQLAGSWSTPVEITGTGFPTNAIDPQITYWSGTYYLLYKNDDSGSICRATSSSPFSGYTTTHTGNWAGWQNGGLNSIEGPKIVDIGTGWRLYFSYNSGFDANNIRYSETTDRTMATGWSATTILADFAGYNHPMPLRRP